MIHHRQDLLILIGLMPRISANAGCMDLMGVERNLLGYSWTRSERLCCTFIYHTYSFILMNSSRIFVGTKGKKKSANFGIWTEFIFFVIFLLSSALWIIHSIFCQAFEMLNLHNEQRILQKFCPMQQMPFQAVRPGSVSNGGLALAYAPPDSHLSIARLAICHIAWFSSMIQIPIFYIPVPGR